MDFVSVLVLVMSILLTLAGGAAGYLLGRNNGLQTVRKNYASEIAEAEKKGRTQAGDANYKLLQFHYCSRCPGRNQTA